MRPLFFDFPADPTGYEIDDQFLFGPDILVAPVLEEGVRNREVYLPQGTSWTDACTGERYEGGCTVVAAAPLERISLFLCAGAQLPVYP